MVSDQQTEFSITRITVTNPKCALAQNNDVNSACAERLGPKFSNVEFITGTSQESLLPLLERLQQNNARVDFVLIDGDHSREGVKRDIEHLLKFRPYHPLYVLMHDSFNPDCRQGMTDANWEMNPCVHFVELDFVPGTFQSRPDFFYRQMWGGFALALLHPIERKGRVNMHAQQEVLFHIALSHSVHLHCKTQTF